MNTRPVLPVSAGAASILAGLLLLLHAGVVDAGEGAAIPVRLAPGDGRAAHAPRYSPKGYRVPLAASERGAPEGIEALEGRLLLGPASTRGDGHLLLVARSEAGRPYDRLWIDTDADGSLEDEETRSANPRTKRKTIYTSFEAVVQVGHGTDGESVWDPYPINLWIAVAAADATPPFIRFSRRGFLEGAVTIDDVAYDVVLSDANNDAVYGKGDWWALLPADGSIPHGGGAKRNVGDFAWAGRQAYRFELEGARGRAGRLVPIDPGVTPEEDARNRDPYWDDKREERAETPVAFRHDVEAAVANAREQGAPYFLDFETEWCVPCKYMDRWVYAAKRVADAAEGIVCIKVDGDEHEDLKEAHEVQGFPTGILFGADGKEVARFRGYQTAARMVAFFRQLHANEEPARDEGGGDAR